MTDTFDPQEIPVKATTPLPEMPDALLRRALRIDGTVSAAAGVAVLAAAESLSAATGMSAAVTVVLGAGSVLCGSAFLVLSRARNVRSGGTSVAGGNAAFTLFAVAAAVIASPPLTTVGVLSAVGAGAYTAAMAAAQYRGLRRMSTQV
ncbi:MAG TPA: hypothetical protein PKK01_15880 [Mycobacterium sp.]|nr:hypothetical protein [Mycobacterium sp.]HPZ93592.1 hypothetical protein [Mycobacterium sp.]HQE14483.1 hypothetical protein [Mycobacterium sp.]